MTEQRRDGDAEPTPNTAPDALLLQEPELPPPDLVPMPAPGPTPLVLPTPSLNEVTPAEGPACCETRVVLRGEHLHRESIVRFDGVMAIPIGARPPRELVVKTPPRDVPGVVAITIQNPGAPEVSFSNAFRFVPLPAPEIGAMAPRRGPAAGGTELTVTGQRFAPGAVVLLGGVRAKTRFIDAKTLEATTPPGKAGALVDVAVENPDHKRAVEARAFGYDAD